jgi:hypothetical protein
VTVVFFLDQKKENKISKKKIFFFLKNLLFFSESQRSRYGEGNREDGGTAGICKWISANRTSA